MSSENSFINSHSLSQYNDSGTLKLMYGYSKTGDVSSGYNSRNSHTVYHLNHLKQVMNYNDSDGMDMNVYWQNGDVSNGISLRNSHTLNKCNKSSNLNEMNSAF